MSGSKRKTRVLLIGIPIAYVLLSVVLSIAGAPVARSYPGLLTYFSFKNGAFTWSYEFERGKVSPFRLGDDRNKTWDIIKQCRCFMIIPGGETPLARFDELTATEISDLTRRDNVLLSRQQLGSPILYDLTFEGNKLTSIRISSSAFSGL